MTDPAAVESPHIGTMPSSGVAEGPNSSTFLTQAEIEDLAVRLAISGIPLEEGLLNFERAQKSKLAEIEEAFRTRKAAFSRWISDLNESIESYKRDLHNLRDKQADLRNSKFKIDVAIQTLRLKKATIRLEARVKQLEREKQFFEDESQKLTETEQQIRSRIIQDKEHELEYAKHLHSTLLEVWQIDEAELNRRAELLKHEEKHATDLLKAAEEKISYLREVGITRTTAGFLVWVGYTAFAGVGGLVGTLLQQRQSDPRAADVLGNFIRRFSEFFGVSQVSVFSWMPFLRMLSFIGAAIVFLVGVTILCDLLLKKFSPRWTKRNVKNNNKGRERKSVEGWKNLVGLFTTGSDRLSLFTGSITRADYVQLMAIMPYVAMAALLLFLISAVGLTISFSNSSTGGSAAATITSASIGAVFILLSTSACLLYATKVIEPRWKRSLAHDPNAADGLRYIKANWEFGALLFVMVSVLLLLTFLPLEQRNNYWAWGLTSLFMTLGSIGLAYGLIYRGLFKDYDVLVRRRGEYLVRIEESILKPTLNDVFEATDSEDLEETAERYRKAKEYLDGVRIESEMNTLFGESRPQYGSDFSRLWFEEPIEEDSRKDFFDLSRRGRRKLYRLINRLGWRKASVEFPSAWWSVAPEAMEQLKVHEEEIEHYQAQAKDIDAQIMQIETERLSNEAKVVATRQEMRAHESELLTVEREYASKIREHNLQRQREEIAFTCAFLTGKFVHDYLRTDHPKAFAEGAGR